jgi:hypothetical protein
VRLYILYDKNQVLIIIIKRAGKPALNLICHCEERSDEAIPGYIQPFEIATLLLIARNDID